MSQKKTNEDIYGNFKLKKPLVSMVYTKLKYIGDVSLLLKQLIRIYESTVIFHTDPDGHSDYYAGFTMTLHA